MKAATMRSTIVTVFLGVTLPLLLVFTPARSAVQPRLLYGTAEGGTELVTFNLHSKTTKPVGTGKIGFPVSLSLALCPQRGVVGVVPYTIVNTFDLAKLLKNS